jgi:predicted histidine transporter YuiF (NhaC family)
MSFEDEYTLKKYKKKRDPLTAFLPALGLILIVALAAIAYVLSEPAGEVVRDNIIQDTQDVDEQQVQMVTGGVIFLVGVLLVGMLYALFAPRPRSEDRVTEADIKKEKEAKQREYIARRKRQKKIAQQETKDRKARAEQNPWTPEK